MAIIRSLSSALAAVVCVATVLLANTASADPPTAAIRGCGRWPPRLAMTPPRSSPMSATTSASRFTRAVCAARAARQPARPAIHSTAPAC